VGKYLILIFVFHHPAAVGACRQGSAGYSLVDEEYVFKVCDGDGTFTKKIPSKYLYNLFYTYKDNKRFQKIVEEIFGSSVSSLLTVYKNGGHWFSYDVVGDDEQKDDIRKLLGFYKRMPRKLRTIPRPVPGEMLKGEDKLQKLVKGNKKIYCKATRKGNKDCNVGVKAIRFSWAGDYYEKVILPISMRPLGPTSSCYSVMYIESNTNNYIPHGSPVHSAKMCYNDVSDISWSQRGATKMIQYSSFQEVIDFPTIDFKPSLGYCGEAQNVFVADTKELCRRTKIFHKSRMIIQE
jgi:hypothetical protein